MGGGRSPSKAAAEEIGRLVQQILELAPRAGLFVSIKIEPRGELLAKAMAKATKPSSPALAGDRS